MCVPLAFEFWFHLVIFSPNGFVDLVSNCSCRSALYYDYFLHLDIVRYWSLEHKWLHNRKTQLHIYIKLCLARQHHSIMLKTHIGTGTATCRMQTWSKKSNKQFYTKAILLCAMSNLSIANLIFFGIIMSCDQNESKQNEQIRWTTKKKRNQNKFWIFQIGKTIETKNTNFNCHS